MTQKSDDRQRLEDDPAPMDYSFVPSVSEGRRLEQMKKIHREEASGGPIVRHRAEPEGMGDLPEYRVHAVRGADSTATVRDTVMRRLPSMADDPAPARSAAYPPGYRHDAKEDYGLPEDPFHPPAETQQRRRRAQQPVPIQPSRAGEGERFVLPQDAPAEIPDWLRVAQQNNLPLERPKVPQPVPAADAPDRPMRRSQPQSPSRYEQAGYPEALLREQQALEAEQAAQPVRRRHGAQYAVNPHRAARTERENAAGQTESITAHRAKDGSLYAPPAQLAYQDQAPLRRPMPPQDLPDEGWHVEDGEERESLRLPAWMTRVPWLGIGAFVSVLAAVILWILGSRYQQDLQLVLAAREAQEIAIEEKHPLKYEGLIDEKAYKYNLSPAFVAAVMLNESSFRPDATASSTGARGLMQLMDDTAEWIHRKLDWSEPYNFDDLYTPEVNAEFGCWYLHYLAETFRGDPILVAAAYHAGQNNVQNWLNTSAYSADGLTLTIEKIPFDDTRRYVTRVMNNYAAYKRLYYGG